MKTFYLILIAVVAFVVFVPPSASGDTWKEPINDFTRFIVLASYNGQAVLDQETGLVWEQFPDSRSRRSWIGAQIFCTQKTVGNRKGWRLPTIQELASLVDPTRVAPALPAGHPFSNVLSSFYWSATTDAGNTDVAWDVIFTNGVVFHNAKFEPFFVWCVRGGQGVDPQ